MLEDVIALLAALGVTGAEDDPIILYMLNSVTERMKNETNQPEIPDGLHHAAVELVVGEYLTFKKNTGQLDIDGLNFEAAIKQIQEGDTNTVFAVGDGSQTPEQRLEVLISRLTCDRTREFIKNRRLLW